MTFDLNKLAAKLQTVESAMIRYRPENGFLNVVASPRGVSITITAEGKVTTYDGECNDATWKLFDIIRQWKIDAEPLAPSIHFVVVPGLPPGWVVGVYKDELVFRVHGEPAGIPFALIDEARKEFK